MKKRVTALVLSLMLICVIVLSFAELIPPRRLSGRADVIRSLYRKLINATAIPTPEPVKNCLLEGLHLLDGWLTLPGNNGALVANMSQALAQYLQDDNAKVTGSLLGLAGKNNSFACYTLESSALDRMELNLFKEKNTDAILEQIRGLVLLGAEGINPADTTIHFDRLNQPLVVYVNSGSEKNLSMRAALVFGENTNTVALLLFSDEEAKGFEVLVEQLRGL